MTSWVLSLPHLTLSKPCPRAGPWASHCVLLPALPGQAPHVLFGFWSSAHAHLSWVTCSGQAPPVEDHKVVRFHRFPAVCTCLASLEWHYRMCWPQDSSASTVKPGCLLLRGPGGSNERPFSAFSPLVLPRPLLVHAYPPTLTFWSFLLFSLLPIYI